METSEEILEEILEKTLEENSILIAGGGLEGAWSGMMNAISVM